MNTLEHPLDRAPYSLVRFVRYEQGVPVYRVEGCKPWKTWGAATALMIAAHRFGPRECFYCRRPIVKQSGPKGPTIDHVRARANGGTNDLWNLVIACAPCNQDKGHRSVHEFAPDLAVLIDPEREALPALPVPRVA